MSDSLHRLLCLDGPPLLAALCAALACGLLGNFLVLRRLSLMGDAISHSVLPGLVIAFLISGVRSPLPMFIGATVAGIATVLLVELVRRLGRVEPGAAMGVVFSVLFALGVLLIERASARQVDLDPDCILHGQLETLFWFPPQDLTAFWSWETYELLPLPVRTLGWTLLGVAIFVGLLFKELRIAAFDPSLATTLGFHSGRLHELLMVVIAASCVAAFAAVGSILVIAMLICPAATARMWTDRLGSQIAVSLVFAAGAAILGYVGATVVPGWFDHDSVNAAGSIAVASGGLLALSIAVAPRHGVIAKAVLRARLARSVDVDDLVAALYRLAETGQRSLAIDQLDRLLPGRSMAAALQRARSRGWVQVDPDLALTSDGDRRGRDLVRRHRLWETYLVSRAGVLPENVHPLAERLEHLDLRPTAGPDTDPHGREIPPEDENPSS